MIEKGAQFAAGEYLYAKIELTNYGKKKFRNIFLNRPTLYKQVGNDYYFHSSRTQLFQYFSRFGNDAYVLSPKIPYSYSCVENGETWVVNFTLGNYIKLYAPNGVLYKGEFQYDFIDETSGDFSELVSILGDSTIESLPQLTNDMSMIVYGLEKSGDMDNYLSPGRVPSFLKPEIGGTSIKADYSPERTDDSNLTATPDDDVSEFHKVRREAIVNTIITALNEKINNHNRYADIMGVNYDFYLPTIANDDWINAVDDISIMAFIQCIPVGPESYYNSYALGASRIIRTDYIYGVTRVYNPGTANEETYHVYHEKECPFIQDLFDADGKPIEVIDPSTGDVLLDAYGNPLCQTSGTYNGENYTLILDDTFVNRVFAVEKGYYPCMECKP